MEMRCVCIPVVPTLAPPPQNVRKQEVSCNDRKPEVDLCKVLERTQAYEENKHNDYECHLKGEKRQNLINKVKMYLDCYDDRPVMTISKKDKIAKGQSGLGPLIKYPGYVDYTHPYFANPYDKLPDLAFTVGHRGENPCPPMSARTYNEAYKQGKEVFGEEAQKSAGGTATDHSGRCCCAERRGEVPKCPAAFSPQSAAFNSQREAFNSQREAFNSQCAAFNSRCADFNSRCEASQQQRGGGEQNVGQRGGQPSGSPVVVCQCMAM